MTSGASSKRLLLKFYVLVFALAVPFWLVGAVVEVEGLAMDLPVSALMLVCPITAAWILVRRDEGPGGMRRLMKRVFDYRKITRRIWYVPMILLMPIALLLTYWVMRLTGVASPEPSTALAEVPILVVAYFIAAVGEEAGWTGYAVDPTQGRWSALGTGLIMGSIWGVWHIVPYVQAHHPAVWVIGQTLGAIPLRVLIVWLYNNTAKSMFAAIVLHAMTNVSESIFPDYSSRFAPAVLTVILAIAAVIVTLLWGSRTLARFNLGRSTSRRSQPSGRSRFEASRLTTRLVRARTRRPLRR